MVATPRSCPYGRSEISRGLRIGVMVLPDRLRRFDRITDALGVLPAGTTNVWAQELGIHAFVWRTCGLESKRPPARRIQSCPMDVGVCNGQPFLMWAGIGLEP